MVDESNQMTPKLSRKRRLLSIDFDGVLHPHDAHYAIDDVSTASVDQLYAAGLFQHCRLLADVLSAHPDVELVVHSSWRKTHDLQSLRKLLGPLGPRLRAVTPPVLEREASVIAHMRRWHVAAQRVIILDDQPELFTSLRSQVIACDGSAGLPSAVQGLEAALQVRFGVPIERMGFPSAEWMSAVDDLVEGVLELVSESGELNLHTSSLGLEDLRRLAQLVRDSA